MRTLLGLLLILCIVQSGLCCGKKKKGKLLQNTGCTQGAVYCLVGQNVQTSPYAAGADSPGDCTQLSCNLDSSPSCCWINNQPPADQLNWVQATGQPDPAKLQNNFGTQTAPSGNYFLTASDTGGTAQQSAQLYSCTITCSNSQIQVSVQHWQSAGTALQVCSLSDPTQPPQNCQPLPAASGNTDQVSLPQGQNVRVVIQAVGFTNASGTVAMLDNIAVQCDPCVSTTSPAGTTVSGAPPGNPPCKAINCNFEQGNPCSYTAASGGGTATENWGVHDAPYQNRLTGIPKGSGDGSKFAACYTKKKGEKSTLQTQASFDKEYVVRYQYYKATEGVIFKACCNDETTCPKDSSADVQTADYRAWKTESISCPAGTSSVLFVCENKDGQSEGACGLDNIQLLQSTGGDPHDASQPAC